MHSYLCLLRMYKKIAECYETIIRTVSHFYWLLHHYSVTSSCYIVRCKIKSYIVAAYTRLYSILEVDAIIYKDYSRSISYTYTHLTFSLNAAYTRNMDACRDSRPLTFSQCVSYREKCTVTSSQTISKPINGGTVVLLLTDARISALGAVFAQWPELHGFRFDGPLGFPPTALALRPLLPTLNKYELWEALRLGNERTSRIDFVYTLWHYEYELLW